MNPLLSKQKAAGEAKSENKRQQMIPREPLQKQKREGEQFIQFFGALLIYSACEHTNLDWNHPLSGDLATEAVGRSK